MADSGIVFKKKNRRNFRKKNINEDNDEEDNSAVQTEATDVVEKAEKKPVKAKKIAVLSFDQDDEESGEVFKVKKSKESRRLAKLKKKSKEEKKSQEEIQEVDESGVTDERLESLREELSNLGEDGDQEGSNNDLELKKNSNNTIITDDLIVHGLPRLSEKEKYHIPDAAAIHAARKKREMARQLGPDYIPIDDTDRYSGRFEKVDKSRLIREDDNDQSDDEQSGPIGFGTKKSNLNPEYQRRLEVEKALAKESESDSNSEEGDDALRRFEEEQMRKAVSVPQTQQEENPAYNLFVQQRVMESSGINIDANLNQETTPGFIDQLPRVTGSYQQSSYPPTLLNNVTMDMIWDTINNRIISLQEVHRNRRIEKDKMLSQMESCDESIKALEKQMVNAEDRFGFFQEMRGYVRDLIECLNEKMPVIMDLESRMHLLLKQRSDLLIERRQQDVRDQAEDFAAAQSGKQATQNKAGELDEYGRDKSSYLDQAKQRRAVERDARRSRRRRKRETMIKKDEEESKKYHEGLSSDDEQSNGDLLHFKTESDKIMAESKDIFEDVIDDFSDINTIKTKFQHWKYGFPDTYKQAFIHLCLPKLFLPFVKIQLLNWNPLIKECKDFEEMSWFENLMFYGFVDNEYDPDDEDTNLIPRMAEKVLLPKISALVELVWDPLSLQQTVLIRNLVKRLVLDYPTITADKKPTQELFNCVVTRIKKCINDDVYVPLYPKMLLDKKSLGAEVFVERQFWSCLKLLGNVLLWYGLLSTQKLQELAIDGLLNRYLLLSLQHSPHKPFENVVKCQAIASVLPRPWFVEGAKTTIQCMASFARYLENLVKILKMKAEGSTAPEKKKVKNCVKKVISMLMQIRACDISDRLNNTSNNT